MDAQSSGRKANKRKKVSANSVKRKNKDNNGISEVHIEVSREADPEVKNMIKNALSEDTNEKEGIGKVSLVSESSQSGMQQVLAKVFQMTASKKDIYYTVASPAVNIRGRQWPATSIQAVPVVNNNGIILFRESVPQFSSCVGRHGWLRDYPRALRKFSSKLCKLYDVEKPFYLHQLRSRSYNIDEAPVSEEGFSYCKLLDHIQRNSQYVDDESQLIRDQLNSLRCNNTYTSTPTPFLYNVEAGLFDGPVQTMVTCVANEIYGQHLVTFDNFRQQHLDMFGPGFTLRHYPSTHLDKLIYYEPIIVDTAGVVARLRDAGPVLVEQVINVLFERVVVHKNSSNSASSQIAASSNLASFTSSEALSAMNRLDEARVSKVVLALMKAAVLRKSRITITIDIFNADLESFVVSLLVFILFPMDVVDEQTQRQAATCVAIRLNKLSKIECDNYSVNDILRHVNLGVLNSRINNADLHQITGNMLHNNDTRYKMPLNFDVYGNTRISGVTNWSRDVDRRVRLPNQDVNFTDWFLRKVTSTVDRMLSLNNVFGVLGAAFSPAWKNMDADRPIILTRVDLLSFCAMYEGVGALDVPTESLSLNACVRSIDVQLQKIAKLSQEYENIIQDEGMSSEAVNDALHDLERSLLEQADDEAKHGDTTLAELLETMKDKLGKSALKDFIRLSHNDGPMAHTAYENVVESIMRLVDDMPSRFGITRDLILSRNPLPFRSPSIDYFGIYQNDEHPFRHVPPVQTYDAGAICGMSVRDVMSRLSNTICIRGAFTYDLICSSDEDQYLSNVQSVNTGFSSHGELNLVPLNCDGKFINFNHFAVHALMYGRHSALSEWIQTFLPRHYTYVTPRNDFMKVSDLQVVRVRFAQSHQEFDSPTLEFRKLDA